MGTRARMVRSLVCYWILIMTTHLYSPSTNGFYTKEIHGDKIPTDCIAITEEKYNELFKQQTNGHQIVAIGGTPTTIPCTQVAESWDEVISLRNELLQESDWVVLADANPKPNKQAWLDYRQELRDIPQKYTTLESIVWPVSPNTAK
jgi:hypothetical protein